MENNHTLSGELMVKRNRGHPRKHPKIESNLHSIGPPSDFSMTKPQIRLKDPLFGDWMVKRKRSRSKKHSRIEPNLQSVGPPPGFSMTQSQIYQRNNVFKLGRCVPVSVDHDVAPHPPMMRRNNDVVHHHPMIPTHCVVPVVLHRQNDGGGVPNQRAHEAIIRNPVVSVKSQPPHLRGKLPVNRD